MSLAYLGNVPKQFVENTDVELHVGGKQLPAHHQILASQSDLFAKLLMDMEAHPHRSQKFVILSELLPSVSATDVERFLETVYNASNQLVKSPQDAAQLYRLADLFKAPKLMLSCTEYLNGCSDVSFLKATTDQDGALEWLLIAENPGMGQLHQKCLKFLAENYRILKHDPRMKRLSRKSYLELAQYLHFILDRRSGHDICLGEGLYNPVHREHCQKWMRLEHCNRSACPGHVIIYQIGWNRERTQLQKHVDATQAAVQNCLGESITLAQEMPRHLGTGLQKSIHQPKPIDWTS